MNSTFVKEIFSSIQGEGVFVGEKQLFVRFCGCNLSCKFCDTDFSTNGAIKYSIEELRDKILTFEPQTISLTGGEPLLQVDFLNELLNYNFGQKIYLETNGVLHSNLEKIIDKVDIIAMDIKLKSATGEINRFLDNEKFLKIANNKHVFIKVVFDENISDNEIAEVCMLAKKFTTEIILQPKMPISNGFEVENVFDKFYFQYKNVRLIAQTHKFLNLK